jgi:hypothetical protein
MRGICRLLGAIVVAGGLLHALGSLELATAQVATKQVKLTEKQIESFIAAQQKMSAAKVEDEFEAIAKEYGFTGIEEHDDVEANILLLMEGIDPRSKAFIEPPSQIRRRIDETKTDKSLPDAEKKQAVDELTEALKSAQPIQFPANVELVRRYYDKIQAVLQ